MDFYKKTTLSICVHLFEWLVCNV